MKKVMFISLFVAVLMMSTSNSIGQSTEKETRNVSGFTEIGFGIAGNLHVKIASGFNVVIEGDKKYLSEIETTVRNGNLIIRNDNNRFFNNLKADIYITLPELKGIYVSGSGNAMIESAIKNEVITLNVSGSGKLMASEIVTDKLNCSISGSGDVILKGSGEIAKGDISIKGSGNYSGATTRIKDLHVHISGSGNCTCNVTESLDASISGSGNINYTGDAKVNARVSGSGHVRSK
jgi:hypothetical protein